MWRGVKQFHRFRRGSSDWPLRLMRVSRLLKCAVKAQYSWGGEGEATPSDIPATCSTAVGVTVQKRVCRQ